MAVNNYNGGALNANCNAIWNQNVIFQSEEQTEGQAEGQVEVQTEQAPTYYAPMYQAAQRQASMYHASIYQAQMHQSLAIQQSISMQERMQMQHRSQLHQPMEQSMQMEQCTDLPSIKFTYSNEVCSNVLLAIHEIEELSSMHKINDILCKHKIENLDFVSCVDRLQIPPEFVFKKESKYLTVNSINRNIFLLIEKKIDEYVSMSEMSNAVSLTYSSDVFNGKDPEFSLQRKLSYQVRSKKMNDLKRDCNNQYMVFQKYILFLHKEFDSLLNKVRNAIQYQVGVQRQEWYNDLIQQKYLEIKYLNPLFWAIYECAMVCFVFFFFLHIIFFFDKFV